MTVHVACSGHSTAVAARVCPRSGAVKIETTTHLSSTPFNPHFSTQDHVRSQLGLAGMSMCYRDGARERVIWGKQILARWRYTPRSMPMKSEPFCIVTEAPAALSTKMEVYWPACNKATNCVMHESKQSTSRTHPLQVKIRELGFLFFIILLHPPALNTF